MISTSLKGTWEGYMDTYYDINGRKQKATYRDTILQGSRVTSMATDIGLTTSAVAQATITTVVFTGR